MHVHTKCETEDLQGNILTYFCKFGAIYLVQCAFKNHRGTTQNILKEKGYFNFRCTNVD